jgi:hypothetical protein
MLMSAALAACLLLQAPQAEETVSSGNVLLKLPPGWKCSDSDKGLFLQPGDLKEGESFVVVVAGEKADGNLAEGLEKFWKQVGSRGKITNKAPGKETKTDGGTDGLLSVGIVESDESGRMIVTAAIFKPGDRYEMVLAMTTEDGLFQKYSETFRVLLKSLRFKNVELPIVTPPYDLLLSMGYTESAGKTTVLVMFKDASYLPFLPGEGLDQFDLPAARRRFDGSWGSHETKDGVLTLRLGDKVESLKAQADGSYRSKENVQYVQILPSTGLKLDGRFVIHGREDKAETSSLVFRKDGTFEDSGGISAILTPAEARTNPGKTGDYEIANNTATFKYPDSRSKKVSFLVLPKAADPKGEFILLNGTWFKRP